jgi:uncharacterized membrane protein
MEIRALWVTIVAQVLITAAFFLILPRITRRGLLFGVYVGESRSGGDEAKRITLWWYTGVIAALILSLTLGLSLLTSFPRSPAGALASIFALLTGQVVVYLRAYFQAKALAAPGAPALSAAPLVPDQPGAAALPALAIISGLVAGVIAVGYTWLLYPDMPARVPTHFGISGRPDGWAARSFSAVMPLPILTLVISVALGGMTWMTAVAKRAIRASDHGVSVAAQMRFRKAMTRFLGGVTLLTASMMTLLSISAARVAVGLSPGLPVVMMALTVALLVFALGGALYIAFRYGQGGARLERGVADAPLTNGLADNSRWVLGAFYVNRDDPSFFVEKRFGLGYTINFGNPTAIALFVGFLVLTLGFTVVAWLAKGS